MREINGKKHCLAGICEKKICDDENEKNCKFYVDLELTYKRGIWNKFGER